MWVTGQGANGPGVDRDDPRPLYAQIRDALHQQILGGTLLPGDALPTEEELQQRFGVARSVVRQALAGLADGGWIHRRRGRGSVVAAGGADHHREAQRAGGFGEQVAATGRALRTEVDDVRRVRPPDEARAGLDTDDSWQVDRRRLVDDEPALVVRTWLPVALFPAFDARRLVTTPLHDLMRESGYVPVGGRRHVTAVPADDHLAARLGVAAGAPLLLLSGVTRDAAGRGLEWFSVWHRPNTVFDLDARVEQNAEAADDRLARLRRLSADLADLVDEL